jgi:meso-butanediol dehydrogenase/(S,S)-butanediol dehydrogenase/diacetyl reductase
LLIIDLLALPQLPNLLAVAKTPVKQLLHTTELRRLHLFLYIVSAFSCIEFNMSRTRFVDQVIFVTGGSSGLGAETCQLFIDEGAKVFVTDLEERGILKRLGPNASYRRCDISDPQDCEAAIGACIETYGRLDVLFNNGARLAPISTVVEHDLTLFQQVINTNLCGLFYLCRIAIPQMRKQGKGAIVATASTAGLRGDFGLCSYSAAKAGTVNLIRTMALDHAREGIRINCVCPGYSTLFSVK